MEADHQVRYHIDKIERKDYVDFVLGGDIGGTHTNLGMFGLQQNRPVFLFSLHFQSQELVSLVPAVQKALTYARDQHGIEADLACLGAAGLISPGRDFCQPTNVRWTISAAELLENTTLNSVFLINDFEAIGYGINLLDPDDPQDMSIAKRKGDHDFLKANRAVIGAGTGLGKSILVYSDAHHIHIPLHSEGGHADFPVQSEFELALCDFVKQHRDIEAAVDYEELLSGRGIESTYLFLRSLNKYEPTKYTKEIDDSSDRTPLVAAYREKDETCRETIRLFTLFYARCAKNFVLDALAQGGLYIAGGIAAKNPDIFQTGDFLDEFIRVEKLSKVLQDTAVYVIVNENVGMLGAVLAAIVRREWAIKKSR